jgi:glycosyltransferase involved in cell wall biosynthesis
VSVIIPNYNHAVYLKRRIDSVLNQTCRDFELIILDDASTDNSRDIIESYRSHPSIAHVVYNDVNGGSPFKQWEKGLNLARGEWVWIAESDDYAEHTFLEKMLAEVDQRPNVGIVYCDSHIVQNNHVEPGTFIPIKNKQFNTTRWSHGYTNRGVNEIEDYLLAVGTINNTSAALFNRAILIQANPFDRQFRFIGDKYVFIKVLALSDIVYVADSLNYYCDPFNAKHEDKLIFLFYEHFLVLDWVRKHLKLPEEKFNRAFNMNTRSSVYRAWNRTKFRIYSRIFLINPQLAMRSFVRNLLAPLQKRNEK